MTARCGKVLALEVAEACRPDWYCSDRPAHVPLPDGPTQELPGDAVLWGTCLGERIPLVSVCGGATHARYDWERWREYVLMEDYRTLARPLYTRLPFHYHAIPGFLRSVIFRFLYSKASVTSWPKRDFPGYPIEQGFELLRYVYAHAAGPDAVPARRAEIALTHDIDSPEGFAWVRPIATLEMQYGFRSLWNVVGRKYRIDYGVCDWLADNGFEIGLHGYNHDNKLVFVGEPRIRARLERCRPFMQRYRVRSFRSPSWFRTRELYRVLKDYFQKDYSALDSDILCPGGHGGCLSTRPFTFEELTLVPCTVPFEAPLLFGYRPEQVLDFWKEKLSWLQAGGGDIVVNTHPDPYYGGNEAMLAQYEELLKRLAAPS
jgi:peptidoglycan/xylan/chitin deacetylase (PgdA/CDA1 family)